MTANPPFLNLADEQAYRTHFHDNLCTLPLRTSNGTPVYVAQRLFEHAFFESRNHNKVKDEFSVDRAKRMEWIALTLASGSAIRVQGWDSRKGRYVPDTCVFHAFEMFVVVVKISRDSSGSLKGNLITCYHADRSLSKILSAPAWTFAEFAAAEKKA